MAAEKTASAEPDYSFRLSKGSISKFIDCNPNKKGYKKGNEKESGFEMILQVLDIKQLSFGGRYYYLTDGVYYIPAQIKAADEDAIEKGDSLRVEVGAVTEKLQRECKDVSNPPNPPFKDILRVLECTIIDSCDLIKDFKVQNLIDWNIAKYGKYGSGLHDLYSCITIICSKLRI